VFEPVPADMRRPDHFTRHHGPPIAPEQYLATTRHEAEALGAARIATTPIADPVSAADGLVDHLASRPARLLVVGRRHGRRPLGAGVVRNVLDRVAAPLLVVNRTEQETEA